MENNVNTISKQYIITKFNNEQFGINIKYVQNIVRMQRITRVPKAPSYIQGVINLRGDIIPVMSLRDKFGLEKDEYTDKTRIIIVELEDSNVGLIVDEVKEVIQLNTDLIEKVNQDSTNDKSHYLSGIGKYGEELISLLNLKNIIDEKENI
ncbi:purine-binding chemotaxis protein CheW [Natranaerovirga hydrolytica]|uniref:Chemotaxis protein CheW n=1 Tax=Natranaerovirga hydrolytica TaxID=680378 RepID=A0A4R1MXS3_9FIRM|nr:chemotaxis protein CheW [Natranaerovirga hydrolytica]TCK97915.1 purine-binding chemotaxis protein CheW [Natranaerovirga hydrolytica]